MKKKDKEIIHRPDIVVSTVGSAIRFLRDHVKQSIIAVVVLCVLIGAGYAYTLHIGNQNNKVQFKLSQGIQAFDEYEAEGKKENLDKAEKAFNDIVRTNRGQSPYIAKLYLAKMNYMLGKSEEAKKLYLDVSNNTSNKTLKALSLKAIQGIEKKL